MKEEFLKYLENIRKYSSNTIINYELDINLSECFISSNFSNKFILRFRGECPFDFINTISKKYTLNVILYEICNNETEVHLVISDEE